MVEEVVVVASIRVRSLLPWLSKLQGQLIAIVRLGDLVDSSFGKHLLIYKASVEGGVIEDAEGSIGLLLGAQKFDSKKGNKMSTYVYWWIRQAIIKSLAKKSHIVRLPGYLCTMNARVAETKSLLRDKLKRLPTYDEIAETVGISAATVRLISLNCRRVVSIDQLINGEKIALKDILQGPEERRPEYMVNRQQFLQILEMLLKTLGEREEYIIRSYFGTNGDTSLTFEEIGNYLKLSRERVRQIYYNALERLKEKKDLLGEFTNFVA